MLGRYFEFIYLFAHEIIQLNRKRPVDSALKIKHDRRRSRSRVTFQNLNLLINTRFALSKPCQCKGYRKKQYRYKFLQYCKVNAFSQNCKFSSLKKQCKLL